VFGAVQKTQMLKSSRTLPCLHILTWYTVIIH